MKCIILISIIVFVLISNKSYAQARTSVVFSVKADTFKIRKYKYNKDTLNKDLKTIFVPMKFNDSKIEKPNILEKMNDGLIQIISVDFVYTQNVDRKKQEDLNKRRLLEMYLVFPDLFKQSMTKWNYYEQLGFTAEQDANLLYHGFVIKFRKIKRYEPRSFIEMKKDVLSRVKKPIDSTIYETFLRNPDLDQKLIAIDFTGSMSPYYLEVMAWLCMQNYKQNVSFSFFNDGDSTADELKIIGRTKGIYLFESKNLDTIVNYAKNTIMGGYGGDCPENDIEAILRGLEKYKDVKEVILVADNWSDMRDYSLLYLVKKPVRVILCGTEYGINPQYLNLAKATGGSVQTIKRDLLDLYKLNEGQSFDFNGQRFKVSAGRIIKL